MSKYSFKNDNEETKQLMMREFLDDCSNGRVYFGERLKKSKQVIYQDLFKQAIENMDLESFVIKLYDSEFWEEFEVDKNGVQKKINTERAAIILAEGEFNRLYIRAVCLAAEEKKQKVTIYRFRDSKTPDPVSEAKIGTSYDPKTIYDDVKNNLETKYLPRPSSGISIYY